MHILGINLAVHMCAYEILNNLKILKFDFQFSRFFKRGRRVN
jgi:hypothetical protein